VYARPAGEDDFVDLTIRKAAWLRRTGLFHFTNHFDYWWR
jgi:hypothetical protein